MAAHSDALPDLSRTNLVAGLLGAAFVGGATSALSSNLVACRLGGLKLGTP